ncbi:MAG: hypothetical protein JWQ16_3455 [Novosphingobium sp.]|nr:hypothetical protein [Novosphingobium sp.]
MLLDQVAMQDDHVWRTVGFVDVIETLDRGDEPGKCASKRWKPLTATLGKLASRPCLSPRSCFCNLKWVQPVQRVEQANRLIENVILDWLGQRAKQRGGQLNTMEKTITSKAQIRGHKLIVRERDLAYRPNSGEHREFQGQVIVGRPGKPERIIIVEQQHPVVAATIFNLRALKNQVWKRCSDPAHKCSQIEIDRSRSLSGP